MMKTQSLLSILCALVAALVLRPSCAVAEETRFSVGVVPQFEARKLAAIWTPVLEEISARAGVTLYLRGSADIPEFEQSFQEGVYDFAYMNPYHSLVALRTQGYEPIIRDNGRKLFGVLVVRKDSDFETVEDLEGGVIAYPAPNALGASLLMRAVLDRDFGLEYRADFVKTHSSAYLNVALGAADAAGGVMGTFRSLDPSISSQLRIIYKTVEMPPHPLTSHPRVPARVREKVVQAFLDLAETPDGRALLDRIPIKQAFTASKEEYEVLKALDLEKYYIQELVQAKD